MPDDDGVVYIDMPEGTSLWQRAADLAERGDFAEAASAFQAVAALDRAPAELRASALLNSAVALHRLGDAAVRISQGDYNLRVQDADSRELDTLANSFNAMAEKLGGVEATRRRLLTDLAHEIRTPLASMEICVESLEDGAIDPGPEAWRILTDQIQRISRLAGDIGQVSAAEEGRLAMDLQTTNALELAERAIRAARDGYDRKQVTLTLTSDPSGPDLTVEADAARIGQVLGNLLSNALRHTAPGGRVELSVASRDGWVELQVADDGDGIS
ncbi:MAG: HAMP domain-containing histidine kinase, partial [Actinobacteria bacterium]|nr:HAMP domain-containing histidine kinase [Actinomycetota bacterium]